MKIPATVVYLLAVLLGLAAGMLEITVSDLLATAIFVMIATMALGVVRPAHAWQWAVIVGALIPIVRLLAYLVMHRHSTLAESWESGLGFVTGTVGAYAGAFTRRVIAELFGTR